MQLGLEAENRLSEGAAAARLDAVEALALAQRGDDQLDPPGPMERLGGRTHVHGAARYVRVLTSAIGENPQMLARTNYVLANAPASAWAMWTASATVS